VFWKATSCTLVEAYRHYEGGRDAESIFTVGDHDVRGKTKQQTIMERKDNPQLRPSQYRQGPLTLIVLMWRIG